MGQPAARVGDMHVCAMVTGLIPHIGGPVLPTGCPTVLIGGMPAARVGDMLVCAGGPDVIAAGACTVLIGGMPAAQMGSTTAHGGNIISGAMNVLIGSGSGTQAGSAPDAAPDTPGGDNTGAWSGGGGDFGGGGSGSSF